jgi:O-antigen/teichoic acid export membrane protein
MQAEINYKASKRLSQTKLRGRLLKGIGAQGFSQAVQIFIRLAEVPLLLSFWGAQLYGEWLMLAAIPSYLSIADGGFAGAACREMAMRSGAGDRNGTLNVFQSTWVLLMLFSGVAVLLAFGVVHLAPFGKWLGFSAMGDHEVKAVLLFLFVHVLFGFQGSLLNGGFWVAGCYPKGMYLITLTQLLEFAGLAISVFLGGGPVQASCGYLAGRILGTALLWLGQMRVSPWLRYGVSHASIGELRRLFAPAFASLAFPLGNAMNIQGTRLIVGLVLGPPAVALFVPLRTVSRLVMQPAAIINRLIEPELAVSYGAGDINLFRRVFTKSCQFSIWGCLTACFFVGPGAYWIFPTWTGGKVPMHWPTYLILLAGIMINSIWNTALMIPYATNRYGQIAKYYTLIYGLGAAALGYIGAVGFGIVGTALAILIAEGVMAAVIVQSTLRLLRLQMKQWSSTLLHPPFDKISSVGGGLWKRVTASQE